MTGPGSSGHPTVQRNGGAIQGETWREPVPRSVAAVGVGIAGDGLSDKMALRGGDGVAVVDPRYVYEDLLTMPDDGRRYELLEGDLLVSPSPNRRHQRIVSKLVGFLLRLEEAGKGEVYPAPFDVVFDRHTVFEPDVLFIRAERLGIVTERNVSGAPDLVVEVLSESTREVDLGRKLHAYGRHGVGEYWVVDPDANTVQVFRREGEAFVEAGTVGRGSEIEFLGARLKVGDILA